MFVKIKKGKLLLMLAKNKLDKIKIMKNRMN